MAKYKDDGKAYLTMYPDVAKRWINECIICHHQGYKPEMVKVVEDDGIQANIISKSISCVIFGHFQ